MIPQTRKTQTWKIKMARHNKKRNVGLIYEQLIMRMSRALVENEDKKIEVIKEIITKRFAKNTQLYKEFRLFNALIRTAGVSESLATRILGEAQKAAQDHDPATLDREKSVLIKDINYHIKESNFYAQRVDDYTNYATIQTLLNAWRSNSTDIKQMTTHEKKIHEWLCRPDNVTNLVDHKAAGVNDLSVKIMERRFMKKYGDVLTSRQKVLMQAYLVENTPKLVDELKRAEIDLSRAMRKYKKVGKNKILLEKTEKVQEHIGNISLQPTSEGVAQGMVLCQLLNELSGEINE